MQEKGRGPICKTGEGGGLRKGEPRWGGGLGGGRREMGAQGRGEPGCWGGGVRESGCQGGEGEGDWVLGPSSVAWESPARVRGGGGEVGGGAAQLEVKPQGEPWMDVFWTLV